MRQKSCVCRLKLVIGSKRSSKFFVPLGGEAEGGRAEEADGEAKAPASGSLERRSSGRAPSEPSRSELSGSSRSQFYVSPLSLWSPPPPESRPAKEEPVFEFGRPTSTFYRAVSVAQPSEESTRGQREPLVDMARRVMSMEEMEDGDDGGEDAARLEVVESLMRQWEAKYSQYRQLSLFAATFNINGQPPQVDLEPWLTRAAGAEPPDLYAIGFQELDLSQSAFFNGYSGREDAWAALCAKALHPKARYVQVSRARLVGMLLIVYAREELRLGPQGQPWLQEVHTATVGTGILNRGGNKGGVGVSLRLADTSLLFLCSHLAAGSDELARRNQDFREISRLGFGPKRLGLLEHDAVVWLGDLNYRFAELSPDEVKYACAKEDWAGLGRKDQLLAEQAAKRAFVQFQEGQLAFQPTYKYDPGTDDWDSSEKGRAPAWCDRVLFLPNNTRLELLSYSSVPSIRISDHKPVFANFRLQIRQVDEPLRQKFFQEALKEGDRRANEALPQVKLSTPELPPEQFMLNPTFDFGRVQFLHPTSKILTLKNTGKFAVAFRFRPKPGDEAVTKPWLTVFPPSQRVKPGEEVQINLQVLMDKETVWELNRRGAEELEDMLVLHLRFGRDFFISVSAVWSASCFGLSLEEGLLRNPVPVRAGAEELLVDLSEEEPKSPAQRERERQASDARRQGVPFALFRLVHHIQTHGLAVADLFSQAGSHKDFEAIRACLDEEGGWGEGTEGRLPGGIHSVVEALLRLLDSLPEPLIPRACSDACLRAVAAGQAASAAWSTLVILPPAHRDALLFLVKFLRRVHANAHHNATNIDFISSVFASVLFGLDRAPPAASGRSQGAALSGPASQARQTAASLFLSSLIRAPQP